MASSSVEVKAPSNGGIPAQVIGVILRSYPLFLVAIAWEAVARAGWVQPVFLPPLSSVLASFPQLVATGEILGPLLTSLHRAAAGLAIAMTVGITLGFWMARSRWAKWLFDPLVALGFPAPKVAFLPIFILWFGIDHMSKIALVAITCVFPFILAAEAGARTVPRVQLWAAEMMGTPRFELLWRIVLPATLPSLMSGVRIAVPFSLVSAFTAEMIAGGGGLGGGLVYAQRFFETQTVFALLLVMLATGYLVDYGLLALRRRLLRWH
ncbi:ABC transporter permease [Bosea sp. (in: a-proteobacteria)]|jgi:ABC-type nitrate/sulfonate/bicarbonate transport system permease component|uniref:ABC transporter permease n=1 Tax=Bosea sp. (in: a-proteobacteria) TaxID=1871050 RepID=UPI002DDCFD0A|nr:ABC transporter permease [Bosea sp. (in: a-proteobacteria)]HEV2508424.1 ABC transporter permease [Bosea sp. (in: a-proteobacteria)]